MKPRLRQSILCTFILSTLLGLLLVQCSGYTLGTLSPTSCNPVGVVLDDQTTCYCDPSRFIVRSDTMTCNRKLRLGYYPVLKNVANSGVTNDKFAHVLETTCNSACRTCQISDDFSTGNAAYCTSCDLTTLPILDIGVATPTCVADLPTKRAMVIVQNNQILGVSNLATKYGGQNSDGTRTTQAQTDPNSSLQSASTAPCTTSTMNIGGGVNSSVTLANNAALLNVGIEADLPKVMDIINSMGVLGIGVLKDQDNICASSMVDLRLPLDYHPGIVMLAVPCPNNCDACTVTQNGNLACTKATSPNYVMDGKVVASCPTAGYLVSGNTCIKCSKSGNGCKTCATTTVGGVSMIDCSVCFIELGYVLQSQTVTGGSINVCNQQQCLTDKTKYWNGSTCVSCISNCAICNDTKCASCSQGYYLKIASDGTRTCVSATTGCGTGYFADDQNICQSCHTDCATCSKQGADGCLTCSSATKYLLPIKKLLVTYNNLKSDFQKQYGSTQIDEKYEIDSTQQFPGTCVTSCSILGPALYVSSGVCTVCPTYGCTACDTSGVCTQCDKQKRLSLITNSTNSAQKICVPCTLTGCNLCSDTDNTKCKMCASGYALDSTTNLCISDCGSGKFMLSQTLATSGAPVTLTQLSYNVCTACTGDCKECSTSATTCILCTDSTKYAKPDGTCATSCDAGYVPLDGRCTKCGDNVATCQLDATTKQLTILTCSTNYYLHPTGKLCVSATQCGTGYYTSSGTCAACDASCSACTTSSTFCLKCADTTKFVSSDGSCQASASSVTCAAGYFKDPTGICIACDASCDSSSGCTGPNNNNCKKCASGYFVLATYSDTSPVTYKCGKSCPSLAEVATVSTQSVCNTCYGSAKPVYDFTTKTCITDTATCPANTVKTTLDKITNINKSIVQSSTVDATTVKICAKCDGRCATCLASDPTMCLTCASGLYSTDMTKTINSTTISYVSCTQSCLDGKYTDASNKCSNSCLSNCGKCSSVTTCDRCLSGYFLNDVATPHTCVADTACPSGKYGDPITGKCQACQSPCATCKGSANNCLTCIASPTNYFFDKLGKCYATCPPGTYVSGTNCVACKTSVLSCDTTGTATSDAQSCDSSCNGCAYNSNFCIGCATGKTMAPMGRCVSSCPDNTLPDPSTTPATCKSCSIGCLKCVSETSTCPAGSSATSFSSTPSTATSKCLRCDKNQGYFLFRGKCVKSCPVGTYRDRFTGWCAKCDCNCGTGGCIDRYTCSGCPQAGMSVDSQTGRCKCDATVTTVWASDWKSFTITISSTSVKFRDITAEMANSSTNLQKICRIGDEGSMFDSNTAQNSITDSFASMRCGDSTNTSTEIDYIKSQIKNLVVDNSTSSDYVAGGTQSTYSFPGTSDNLYGPILNTESTVSNGVVQTSSQTSTSSSSSSSQPLQKTIARKSTTCPNQKQRINSDDLERFGFTALDDTNIQNYIQGLGTLFGDISDNDILTYKSPTNGLVFTSSPSDLCGTLFDADTLNYIFMSPTCSMTVSGSSTIIIVTLGDMAQIHKGFVTKVQPNVFIDGCDWPIINVIKLTDGSNPANMNVMFKPQVQSVISCADFSVKLAPNKYAGKVSCSVSLDAVKDSSGNAITTGVAATTKTSINSVNTLTDGSFFISSANMSQLSSNGVSKFTLKGKCVDGYVQMQIASKDITLSTGESDITMTNAPDMIVYDPSQSQDVSFSFSYTNCASTTPLTPTSTITLQKMTGTNTWTDTTTTSEMIQNNKTIPKGLSSTTKYRLKIVAAAGTKSKEFYIQLQFIVKQPDMLTHGIPAYLLASKDYSYTFIINDFKNVADITKVSLSFSCTLCGGGKCTKADSSDLTLSSYYTDSTKLLSIPANTLKADTCYSVGITIAYSGSTNSKSVNMITAPSSIKTAISISFNFNAGQYFDVTSSGFLGCKPQNSDIKLQDVTYSLSLLDSSGSAVTSSCVTTNSNNISYKANCLSSGTSYTFTCTITSKTDSTITGTAKQSFTTQSSVSISASITPTSGNQFTSFVISVTNSGSSTIKCNAGIVDSTVGEGFSPITTASLQVSGQSSSSFSSVSLPVDTQSTSTTVKVLCKSPTVGDTGSASISVTMTKYAGSDASAKATAVISSISSCASSTSCSDGDLLSKVVSNKQLITNMDASTAQSIGSRVISSLESTTLDTSDSQATKVYLSQIDAASSIASKGGLSSSQINSMTNVLQNVLGVSSSTTTLADTTSTTTDSVKSRNPTKGAESVNQLGTEDLKTLLNSLSKIMVGIESNKNQITSIDYENFKKTYMIIIDKIVKSSVNIIPSGSNMSFPFKGLAIYLENLATDSTSINNEINLSYPCPCGSSYKPTTTATDPQALDGTIDPSTASTITATKSSQSASTTLTINSFTSKSGTMLTKTITSGMCSVKVPSLSTISTDISTCKTIMVAVVTSSNMSPNAMVSSTDSSTFKSASATQSTTSLTQIASQTSTDTYSSSLGTTTGCKTSDFTDMKTEGPSIDVAFYCTSSSLDTSGKLSVTRLDITKFNGGAVSYSINCPNSNTLTSSQTETPSFYDSSTGQNSCSGCTTSSDGSVQCGHTTTFSYSIATYSPSTSDWWTGIYANFVLYLLIVIDFYFVAVFIFSLTKRKKKSHQKVMDNTEMPVPQSEEIDQKAGNVTGLDNTVINTKSDELYKGKFCKRFWIGFILKYRMITPFTTEHEELSRIARGVINIIVLLLMWTFSGIINYGLNNNLAGAYCVSILICFIVARLFAFLLEFILRTRRIIVVTILGYAIAFLFIFGTHLAIFLLTEYMGSEFYNWGLIVLTIYLIDLIVWELSSLLVQLYFAKRLAQNADNFSGKRKFISRLISSPLLKEFIEK